MKIKSIVLAIVSTALISSTFAFDTKEYSEFAVKRFAVNTSKEISKHNEVILPALKDKANHLLGNKTNGLYEVSLFEIAKLTNDKVAQYHFMECSITKPVFAFSSECHSLRYKNYMTKYNHQALAKLKNEIQDEIDIERNRAILIEFGEKQMKKGVEMIETAKLKKEIQDEIDIEQNRAILIEFGEEQMKKGVEMIEIHNFMKKQKI